MMNYDEIFNKVINDRQIFDTFYDAKKKKKWPEFFSKEEWSMLRGYFNERKKDEFVNYISFIYNKKLEINRNENFYNFERELNSQKRSLIKAYDEKPALLKQSLDLLTWYGKPECNLPKMEQYGKVIERYNFHVIQQFFVEKIQSENNKVKKKGLIKVLDYIKQLIDEKFPQNEIAYIIRKLNTLTNYWEILND